MPTLTDATGRPVLSCTGLTVDGTPWADEVALAPGRTVAEAVPLVLAALPGWVVNGHAELCAALLEAGARLRRHATAMQRDLTTALPTPRPLGPGLAAVAGLPEPAGLRAAYEAAFAPPHPDAGLFGPDAYADLAAGRSLGPVLPASGHVVDLRDGRPVAACVVTERDGEGAWLGDVFRDPAPAYAGTGRHLVERALGRLAAAGHARLSLAVTVGNPAERGYRDLGFRAVRTTVNVVVPGGR